MPETGVIDKWILMLACPRYTDEAGEVIEPPASAFADAAEEFFKTQSEITVARAARKALFVWEPNGVERFSLEADGRVILDGEVIAQL